MNWLARLKPEKLPGTLATETTKSPQIDGKGVSVGFVACPPAPFQKINPHDNAANDSGTETVADPDRWAWPHSKALNGQEIDTFTARLGRFTDKGITLADAERLADELLIRDREGDDRRLCLECTHLSGAGRSWRCGNWLPAEIGSGGALPKDLVSMLQRCKGFKKR